MRVPTGAADATGKAPTPMFFHGEIDEWAALSPQQQRYVLASMTEHERGLFPPSILDSDGHLHRAVADWTLDDFSRHMHLRKQVETYEREIRDFVRIVIAALTEHGSDRIVDLPPAARERVERETERLFGTRSPVIVPFEEGD